MPSGAEEIEKVAGLLGPLLGRVMFLGGAATGLLITDPAAPDVRQTDDVDVVVEVVSWAEYSRIEEELRGLGFSHRREVGDPICRWSIAGVIVDVMPTDETILGFGSRWYVPALKNASVHSLPNGLKIRVITAPYFLATKLDAFRGRGRTDFLMSSDIADVVSLIDGRAKLVAEIAVAEPVLRRFIAAEMSEYLSSEAFLEAVAGHMLPDLTSQRRIPSVLATMKQLAIVF